MTEVYFLHQIKHNKTTGNWDKGIVVKADENVNNLEAAKQSYHAYLGAYAYNHDTTCDFVVCYITDTAGNRLMWEIWDARVEPEAEPEVGE